MVEKTIMPNKTHLVITLTAISCLLFQSPALSAVYKWQDEEGLTHYSDRPNKSGAKLLSIRDNTTTEPRSIKKDDEEDVKSEPEVKKPEAPKISKTEKRRLCKQARADISSINNHPRAREINSKGEYIRISEKQRQKRLSSAKKKQRKYCR